VDRGEVALDAVVGDLLPGVLRADPPITVRQLLAHTSGVFDEGNEGDPLADVAAIADAALRAEAEALVSRFAAGERPVVPDRVLVALAETHDRYFQPGLGYHYSNVNYQLAVMVLERVTGRSLDTLLRERIVDPLGLERTSLAPADATSPELRGYEVRDDGTLSDTTDDLSWFGNGGNGGILTTPVELTRMLRAIVTAELFTPELVTAMETPPIGSYGLGLARYATACGPFLGHGGSVTGTQSIALMSADGTRSLVLAVNARSGTDPLLATLAEGVLCGP
jgi:D-alanyl-D-alanine carboxypeptidase